MDDSIIPYPVRSYLIFRNKKCRIYAVCGVSQTPKDDFGCEEREENYEPQVIVILKDAAEKEIVVKQSDSWLYRQDIEEGDQVVFVAEKLQKAYPQDTP